MLVQLSGSNYGIQRALYIRVEWTDGLQVWGAALKYV